MALRGPIATRRGAGRLQRTGAADDARTQRQGSNGGTNATRSRAQCVGRPKRWLPHMYDRRIRQSARYHHKVSLRWCLRGMAPRLPVWRRSCLRPRPNWPRPRWTAQTTRWTSTPSLLSRRCSKRSCAWMRARLRSRPFNATRAPSWLRFARRSRTAATSSAQSWRP